MTYLYVLGMKIPLENIFGTLPQKYQLQLVNCYHSQLTKPLLAVMTMQILVSAIPNFLHRLLIKLWKFFNYKEFVIISNLILDYITKETHQLIAPDYRDKSVANIYKRRTAMSFIEFIRLNFYFSILAQQTPEERIKTINLILSVCFHNHDTYDDLTVNPKAQIFENLHPLIKYPIIESIRKEFDDLVNSYKEVFPKKSEDSEEVAKSHNPAAIQHHWLQVARSRSQKITDIEALLNTDASLVLFDFDEAIKEYHDFQRKQKQK